MKDREFLMWMHERLEKVHGERPLVDYMHKLRAIIKATPADKETPKTTCCNSLDELREELPKQKCKCNIFFKSSSCPVHFRA
jgi:hypothetical protein